MVAYHQNLVDQVVVIPDNISTRDFPSINIYPNPTSGRFNIDFVNFAQEAEIHIVNFQGQEVLKINNRNRLTMELNINYLPDGIYLIIVETKSQIITGKIIKS